MDVDDTGIFSSFMLTFFGVTMESHFITSSGKRNGV